MSVLARFSELSLCGKLRALWKGQREILTMLEQIMSRADELKAEVATLRQEQQETKDAAQAAIARVQAKVEALAAQVATLVAGQVTDAELAEIQAATAAVKAEADAAQAEFAAVEPPPAA